MRHPGGQRAAHHGRLLGALQPLEQIEQAVEAQPAGGSEWIVFARLHGSIMPLAATFQEIIESLPSDWTDLEFDLRVKEDRYIDAATLVAQVNAQPYSEHDWHWRIMIANQFGHAAAAPAVHGTLKLLDDQGIAGELALREVRTGRVEATYQWGRPESFRQEFRRLRAQ
jgi:hypothetical protein